MDVLRFGFFFSSRRRHTRWPRDWSADVCSSDLVELGERGLAARVEAPGRGRDVQLGDDVRMSRGGMTLLEVERWAEVRRMHFVSGCRSGRSLGAPATTTRRCSG